MTLNSKLSALEPAVKVASTNMGTSVPQLTSLEVHAAIGKKTIAVNMEAFVQITSQKRIGTMDLSTGFVPEKSFAVRWFTLHRPSQNLS